MLQKLMASGDQGVLLEDVHEAFVQELAIVARRLRSRLDERLRDLGMTQAKWVVLYWLWKCEGGLSQAELAERVGVEPGALVRIIDGLEEAGLLTRQAVPGDRRVKQLRLTASALPVVEKVDSVGRKLRAETLAGVDVDVLKASTTLLRKARRTLDRD